MKTKIQRLRAKYRYSAILLKRLVITDFKIRYQNSVLGYLWTLLRPLGLFGVLYIVFVKFLNIGNDIPHYAVYLLLGIVFWNYFVEVTVGGVATIVSKGDILRKLAFPRYTVVAAGSLSALINLAFNFTIIGVLMVLNDVPLRATAIFLIFPIIELFIFSLSVAFLLSALYVRLRDVSYIWEVFIQAAFYATPILYPLSKIIDYSLPAAKFAMLNPLAQIIQDARAFLVTDQAQTTASIWGNSAMRLIPVTVVLVTAVVAGTYFKKRAPYFAEEL
jgi:ABC-2 type transport system permease protein